MSASVQITLDARELVLLKRLNRSMAVQAAVLEDKRKGEFHMMYCGFCLAMQELGLDQIIDVSKDETLSSLAKLFKESDMDVVTFSKFMNILGYSLKFNPETNEVIGFTSMNTNKE